MEKVKIQKERPIKKKSVFSSTYNESISFVITITIMIVITLILIGGFLVVVYLKSVQDNYIKPRSYEFNIIIGYAYPCHNCIGSNRAYGCKFSIMTDKSHVFIKEIYKKTNCTGCTMKLYPNMILGNYEGFEYGMSEHGLTDNYLRRYTDTDLTKFDVIVIDEEKKWVNCK